MKNTYTTAEAAKLVGIHVATLQRWIAQRKIRAPKPVLIGAVGYRLWSDEDIAEVLKTKQRIYRKGRGRKRKT